MEKLPIYYFLALLLMLSIFIPEEVFADAVNQWLTEDQGGLEGFDGPLYPALIAWFVVTALAWQGYLNPLYRAGNKILKVYMKWVEQVPYIFSYCLIAVFPIVFIAWYLALGQIHNPIIQSAVLGASMGLGFNCFFMYERWDWK